MYEKQRCEALWWLALSTFDLATGGDPKASTAGSIGHLSEAPIPDTELEPPWWAVAKEGGFFQERLWRLIWEIVDSGGKWGPYF